MSARELRAIRPETVARLRRAGTWVLLFAAALAMAVVTAHQPLAALAVPALALSAVLCWLRPAFATVTLLVLTASYGTVGAVTGLSVAPLADLLLAGLWLGAGWGFLAGRRESPTWLWPGVVVSGLYLLLTLADIAASENVELALRSFRTAGWYMLALMVVGFAPWGRASRTRIARGFAAVALAAGAYALLRWLTGSTGAELEIARAVNRDSLRDVALIGSFDDDQRLAAFCAVAIPFCLALAVTFRRTWRLLAAAAAAACTIAVFGTEARSAVAAAVVGAAVVVGLYQLARAFPGLHLGATSVLVCAGLSISAAGLWVASETGSLGLGQYAAILTPSNEPSYQARTRTWDEAWREVDERPLGRGLGTVGEVSSGSYARFAVLGARSLDNSYLKIALEQGVAAMVLFVLGLLLLLFGLARRATAARHPERAGLAIGACGALAAFLLLLWVGTSISGFPALTAWILIGIGVAQFATAGDEEPWQGARRTPARGTR